MGGAEIEQLIRLLARLPGLGPRSARRAALQLIKQREALMLPLVRAITEVAETVTACSVCGNVDSRDPCVICADQRRDGSLLCVVEDVADLWAIERSAVYRGRYHVLGGTLSALDGVGPEDLKIDQLIARAAEPGVEEVVLATNATVDGQTTAHYITDRLEGSGVRISRLASGVPVGGELDYLDDGTLSAAFRTRRPVAGE
ncbi:recombination mediator RecR [Oceanibacterium hippocampi]|uniref:Recombination protein RecR n=1 Tax=Oceanibacterium hippocampi TaxID=745714 RepID=A0A1Y5RU09_9PROT|nr:recombination mediator RecR [Oceanibacterium hippocampi]SLN25260.1 Recombination protein RecR [Oceanibacterium hippocampi]